MPLQTLYYDNVTESSTVAKHALGTVRYEQDKIYKYVLAGGTITANSACQWSARGTVVLFDGSGPGCGFTVTGRSSGDYFWMQTHGEVGSLDTETNITAVGYPLCVTNADGTTLCDLSAGSTQLGESVCAVLSSASGIAYLCGL